MYRENIKTHSNPYIQGTTVPCDIGRLYTCSRQSFTLYYNTKSDNIMYMYNSMSSIITM